MRTRDVQITRGLCHLNEFEIRGLKFSLEMSLVSNILLFAGIEQNLFYSCCSRFCSLGRISILVVFLNVVENAKPQ